MLWAYSLYNDSTIPQDQAKVTVGLSSIGTDCEITEAVGHLQFILTSACGGNKDLSAYTFVAKQSARNLMSRLPNYFFLDKKKVFLEHPLH